MCSCLGFRRWSPVGEAVLMSSPWWTAGGRPHGSFFVFFFTPLCVCVCLHVWRWRAGVVKHRFSKEGRGVVWGGGGGRQTWQKEDSLFRFPPSALPLRTRYGSPAACSSRHRRGTGGSVGDQRVVEVVLLPSSLERARQFVKAFGERGGNLHVT